MPEAYDVTIVTVRPGTHPQALAVLGKSLADDRNLLACWYSDIGAVNQILIIRKPADATTTLDARYAALSAANPLGVSEYTVAMAMDTYVPFDFIPPLRPGEFGHVIGLAGLLATRDPEQDFEAGLDLLITGIKGWRET